eukprot:jgi/Hompol1/355/HPOL_003106-RA
MGKLTLLASSLMLSFDLKRLLEQPHLLSSKPTLWPIHHLDEELEDQRMLYEDDPYADIKMEEIWTLPDKPDDMRMIEPVIYTLKSHDLSRLSRDAMKMIEEEAKLYRTLTRFAEMLQGDDPAYYDVNLSEHKSIVSELQEDAEELVGCVSEVMSRLQETRKCLIKAALQKDALSKQLLQ